MIWCVQILDSRNQDGQTQKLAYAAEELGHKVYLDRYVPFDDEHDFSFLPSDQPVIFHGGIGCVRSVWERKLPIFPFAWYDFAKLSCAHYYSRWDEFLAMRTYGIYPLGEIRRLKDWLFGTYGKGGRIFIRPNSNDKIFAGKVVSEFNFESFMSWVWVDDLQSDVLCVVGTPTEFSAEWRLIVADGKVVAGSQYMDGLCYCEDAHYPETLKEFGAKVAAAWSPHSVFCLDVGLSPDGYRVIECGSANCAGYYQCDLRAIVVALSAVAEQEFALAKKPEIP